MESSIGKTSSPSAVLGLGVARKTKSLDLQSIYKSRISKEGLPNFPVQNGGGARDDSKRKKRKKSGKEVALNSLEPVAKKSKKTLDEGHVNDARSGSVSVDSGLSLSGVSHTNGLNGLSLSLGGPGNIIRIPRRPRGFVGRKKCEGNGSVKLSGPSSSVYQCGKLNGELSKVESYGSSGGEAGSDDKISKLLHGCGGIVGGSKAKRKRNLDEVKKSRNCRSSSPRHAEEEDGHHVVKRNVDEVKESGNGGSSSSRHAKEEDAHHVVKRNVDEVKGSGNGRLSSSRHAKEEDGHHVVKRKVDEVKGSGNGRLSSSRRSKEEDGHHVVKRNVDEVKESGLSSSRHAKDEDGHHVAKRNVNEAKASRHAKDEDGHHVAKRNVNEAKASRHAKDEDGHHVAKRNVNEAKASGNGRLSLSQHDKEEDGHHVVKSNVDEAKASGNGRLSLSRHDKEEDGHHVVKRNVDEAKASGNGRLSSSQHDKEEDGHHVVKKNVDEVKESKNGRPSSSLHAKEEDGHHIVNNGNTSSRKRQRKHRKRMDLTSGSEIAQKKVEHSVENSSSVFDDFQDDDDDEEKLEQNAARMLSSRFDPRCTGFTSKSRTSGRLSDNANCFSGSSRKRTDSLAGLKSKDASRVLRPRKQFKAKGLSRKRRHFYEIDTTNLDAFWFLNRRIKVFWPLDESWYYGLVNDYDPEIKLHHVKYDDRDEEWIDLHNEKFKLLLLPSEVPGRGEEKESLIHEKFMDRRKPDSDDDSYEGSYLDSEPIISWLSRSSRRVKSSPSNHLKQQKTPEFAPSVVSTVLSARIDDRDADVGLPGDSTFPDKSADGERVKNSLLGSPSSSKGSTPVVYVRRRLNKRRKGLSPVRENNKARRCPLNFTSSPPVVDSLHFCEEDDSSLGCSDFDELLWLVDDQGLLRLRVPLGESKRFRFHVCLTVLPTLSCSVLADHFGLSHTLLLSHNGTIMTTWPEVALEMLFVDNTIGLRILLFEGCLKLAVELFSLILTVFNQSPGEWKFFDMELPITSIQFKLASTQDLRRQQEFAFYSFSKLKQSKWLDLDSKLQRHCLLRKRLPISECTYDNIKTLECGSHQLDVPYVGPGFSPIKKRFMRSILPVGVSRESSNKMMIQSAVNSAIKLGRIPTFSLSFPAAPTFFLSLHLKLLMERNFACISLQDDSSRCSFEDSEVAILPTAVHSPQVDSCQENVLGTTTDIEKQSTLAGTVSELLCSDDSRSVRDVNSEECDGDRTESAQDSDSGKPGTAVESFSSKDSEMAVADSFVHPEKCESHNHESEQFVASPVASVPKTESEQLVASPIASVPETVTPSVLSNGKSCSSLGGLSIELPSSDHIDKPLAGGAYISRQVSDLAGNASDGFVQSPCQISLRSSWRRDRNDSSSSPLGDLSPIWRDGKSIFIGNAFGTGPKKPRTRVRYTLPAGGYDSTSKYKIQNPRAFSYKRIRRSSDKRMSDGLISSQKDLELLFCDANVLVTLRDKGWRECGARVVLELTDQNEWRLAVKVSGVTKYSHKVDHVLQAGSTNRFTHAMMWKGGKDWVLEFPDRNQWVIFKEMHEECHNRNIRAASVKNIPIPGVRLVEENDDYATDALFIRNSSMYFRQVESDVDMAMDPLRVLYDMDSDDEDWILKNGKSLSTGDKNFIGISCELFEKVVDMLEKLAYTQQRDQFSVDELEEVMVGIDSVELIKGVYEHWRQKRQRKGMPLIRHLQPPLWESYQQQVKEWEQAVARASASSSIGSKEKTLLIEKPPMFAFCLKPRGLEVPNKGSKQRSQRRFPVSGHSHFSSGDQDHFHSFVPGRRLNGFSVGEDKIVFSGNSHDFSDSSPSLQASARVFSPRDAGGVGLFSLSSDVPEWNHYSRYHWNRPKKNGTFPSPNSTRLVPYPQRTIGMRNGVHRWNMDLPEWPSQKHHISEGSLSHGIEPLDDSDLHEFRLRDASGAAQHALYMAKLKRERAQKLLYTADLAIHKAAVALMTAEAKKDAFDSSNGDV